MFVPGSQAPEQCFRELLREGNCCNLWQVYMGSATPLIITAAPFATSVSGCVELDQLKFLGLSVILEHCN